VRAGGVEDEQVARPELDLRALRADAGVPALDEQVLARPGRVRPGDLGSRAGQQPQDRQLEHVPAELDPLEQPPLECRPA